MHSPSGLGGKGGGGLKVLEKSLLWGGGWSEMFIWVGGGSRNFEVKIKTA